MARRVQRKTGFVSSLALLILQVYGSNRGLTSMCTAANPHIGLAQVIASTVVFCCVALTFHAQALAGLSASEVVVAVNGDSLSSRTLANHYAKLRDIPSVNIVVLGNIPDREQITVKEFREIILLPLIKEIELRNLARHVQCIAYSSDFPTAIDISQDLESIKDLHTVFTKVGSINGLTYLYEMTLKANPAYITPEINFYARRAMGAFFTNPGGKQTEGIWGDASLLENEKEFSKAGEMVDKLVESLPGQYPLKYLSAAYAAQANQSEKALLRLDEAISGGWTSGGYLAADTRFDGLRKNAEFQSLEALLEQDPGKWQPTVAFNSKSGWATNGIAFPWDPKKDNIGLKYILSTVLGVTRGMGTSLEEAIESLKRAKQADFTHPQGGFYFASTSDVRSTTRKPNFDIAVEELKKLGFEAEVIFQELPKNKSAVLGAQIGIASFDWKSCSSKIIPGAIIDNLTSFGGIMASPSGQTPLTHVIAAGAAGSSGTVTEPYSVQFKFPTPHLYVHYAQGLSLAEAFYQSVTGPYQLLIVGDPLCQPFSIAPNKAIDTTPRVIRPNGTIQFQPDLSGPSYFDWLSLKLRPAQRKVQLRPASIVVQIDGGVMQGGNIQQFVNVKMVKQSPGYHEVQVTAVADDPLKQRFQQVVPIWIGERDLIKLTLLGSPPGKQKQRSIADGKISVSVSAPAGSTEVSIIHHYEQVAKAKPTGTVTELSIEPSKLGMGPVRLQAKAQLEDGAVVASQPLWVEIVP